MSLPVYQIKETLSHLSMFAFFSLFAFETFEEPLDVLVLCPVSLYDHFRNRSC
jgi:hypothetical protein